MAIERTSTGLAAIMFDELEALRRGESTPQQARAKASIAAQICSISRLEMDYARFVATERSSPKEAHMSLPMGRVASKKPGPGRPRIAASK